VTETEDEVAGVVFSARQTSDLGEPQTFRETVEVPAKDKWIPSTKDKVLGSINRGSWKKREETPVTGKRKRVQWLYGMIEKKINIDILGKLKKHLGVWRTWHKDKYGETYLEADMKIMGLYIIEPFKIARPDIKLKSYLTPATPAGTTLKKNEGKIIQESDYRSVIGKALYLTTKGVREICNACRELSTHLSSQSNEELGRLVGYMKHP
jgi:hypothetical protein